ncbi:TPA: hypothetical protein MAR07_005294 [Klebsiella pneumoniae]|uniref:hypothetical protein n=1 Tax=Klebsiella pneumoniae TaxID=573 RepID=UPI001E5AB8D3|nr:hypothetical protein [Klebsiella pneumoniae]MCD5937005.1 hypothetical protein [Klebsiella pneumoniae]HBS7549506.1 hypothetical protein [Klebsiella pneumoniae]HBU3718198.1 hypothetical protein [Klebsiella pneumoniae]HBX5355691.1 hypothetical protein [Klebsiella pneumoniae]HBY4307913.1 hypothetical protein [Klebsiella pneumoniae]
MFIPVWLIVLLVILVIAVSSYNSNRNKKIIEILDYRRARITELKDGIEEILQTVDDDLEDIYERLFKYNINSESFSDVEAHDILVAIGKDVQRVYPKIKDRAREIIK